MDQKCLLCTLRSSAENKLNPEELEKLSLNCLTVSFKKGDSIIRQGTYSTNVAYLKEGLVKIHIEGPYFTQVVRIVKRGHYLGLPTTFGDKVNQYSVSAVEPSEVCFIDITAFRDMLSSNSEFSSQILTELCKSELESYQKCVNRTQRQLRGKIAGVILEFADDIYQSDNFIISINQQEMGNLVDASRESVSRVLSEFGRDKILRMEGKEIEILNKKMLINIAQNG
ncbi:MAG: Crp/Fnr family transcriptional regulator [Bacteroidales bacterium]|nr:Crp/Fnr family transcriptional regulator [Bacteroidales bacterium]MDD2424928.1 Crp/Fnr family transcriptional regulator [Bacteroidales bacterium]MDD3989080.1 Crp/Fnr family transcriptional regulator [Bacteroidales bacterium]MDD4639726.1 Crp/Fnr family transcriptional regulator [Bacteroidales bacterium]